MALNGPFNHEWVLANHHASGVANINNKIVTVVASRNVNQIVAISSSERLIYFDPNSDDSKTDNRTE